jgi:hypothetical protein
LVATSKQVFGKQHRLEVASVCGVLGPPVWSRRVARLLGLPENQVAAELNAFAQLGALKRLPLSEFDRRKTFQAAPHPLWKFCRAEFERVAHEGFPEEAEELLRGYWRYVEKDPASVAAAEEEGLP